MTNSYYIHSDINVIHNKKCALIPYVPIIYINLCGNIIQSKCSLCQPINNIYVYIKE